MNFGETCHLKRCDMVTAWTMLLLCCYNCDSTQQHYDFTQFEYVLWRHTIHEWVMNIHYQTWIAQGRFTNIILTPSKQWDVYDDIKNIAWVTVNNDFWVTSEAICQWFSRVTKSRVKIIVRHSWKSLANRITSDPKIVIHGNECIILFLTCYFMSWNTQFCQKPSSIAYFATVAKDGLFWLRIVTSPQLICVITRTRDTSIVASYLSIVLARANWRKGDLHEWITTVNIDFSPPGIYGIACKKSNSHHTIFTA